MYESARRTHPRHAQWLELTMDDRCRALARVLALLEGRGVEIGEVRFAPMAGGRHLATATIEVSGQPTMIRAALARIEALPLVHRARVLEAVLAG